jgi:hypothetical protein
MQIKRNVSGRREAAKLRGMVGGAPPGFGAFISLF